MISSTIILSHVYINIYTKIDLLNMIDTHIFSITTCFNYLWEGTAVFSVALDNPYSLDAYILISLWERFADVLSVLDLFRNSLTYIGSIEGFDFSTPKSLIQEIIWCWYGSNWSTLIQYSFFTSYFLQCIIVLPSVFSAIPIQLSPINNATSYFWTFKVSILISWSVGKLLAEEESWADSILFATFTLFHSSYPCIFHQLVIEPIYYS